MMRWLSRWLERIPFMDEDRRVVVPVPRLIAAPEDFGTQLAKELEGKYCVEADALGGMPDDEDPGAMRAEILEHTVGYFPRAERERIARAVADRAAGYPLTAEIIEQASRYREEDGEEGAREFLARLGYDELEVAERVRRAADRCEAALDEVDPEGLMARGYDIEGNDFTPPTSPIVHAQGAANVRDRAAERRAARAGEWQLVQTHFPNEHEAFQRERQDEGREWGGIPWGSMRLGPAQQAGGRWRPNMALDRLSPADQFDLNLRHGYCTPEDWPEDRRTADIAEWYALHPAALDGVSRGTEEETTMESEQVGAGNRLRRAFRDGGAAPATGPTVAGELNRLHAAVEAAEAADKRLDELVRAVFGCNLPGSEELDRAPPEAPMVVRIERLNSRLAFALARIGDAARILEAQLFDEPRPRL